MPGLGAWRDRLTPLAAILSIVAGGVLALSGRGEAAQIVWGLGIITTIVPLTVSVVRSLLAGDVGVDVIALIAMIGALLVGEELAGVVVALMLAGGNALEDAAGRRARRELTALVSRAPRVAHRRDGESWTEVAVEAILTGDVVLVRAGEVVPVDGTVASASAVVDESALTGEPLPVSYGRDERVRSGSANAADPFEMRASRPASESAYAALVRLVENAQTQRAPFVRMADRYAIWFLGFATIVAGIGWALQRDPVTAVAVFVVATPCPLILAAPIALMSGISRAARRGIIVKGGAVIEQLGAARSVLLDKTGTLTRGAPEVEQIDPVDGIDADELLRLTASVERYSVHVMAEALVAAAAARELAIATPTASEEEAGQGIAGTVEGRLIAVGAPAYLAGRGTAGLPPEEPPLYGRARVAVSIDGTYAGTILLADHLRDDASELVKRLHDAGIRHVAMVSGDRQAVADEIGERVGVDRVYAEQSPEQKLEVVKAIRARAELCAVIMVGDGINDAPALALANVGIAMAGRGATISSETADAVITVDRIDRVVDAVLIGRRSMYIARQSVLVGMGLSAVAMVFAAAGLLPPVGGALLQEVIDVAVILNALRALR
jgi:heavy metal translocating P-type ATPase